MSLGKYVLIEPSELPTEGELRESISRLRKDAEIISQFSAQKHDPISFKRVADFLEAVIVMAGNKLKRDINNDRN